MQDHGIIVGVDGSEGGRLALRWALQEARYRGSTVTAIATWHWEAFDESLLQTTGPQVAHDHTAAQLESDIEAVIADCPENPPVIREVVEGWPAEVLPEAAERAELLVLGSHGHSRLRHAALGSVSEACVQRAACPVVIVPLPHGGPTHGSSVRK